MHYIGDHIVLDNAPIHSFDAADALTDYLYQFGTNIVFTFVYGSEFNAAELVFKGCLLIIMLKRF